MEVGDKMPNYGLNQYGRFQYGRYIINKNKSISMKDFNRLRIKSNTKLEESIPLRMLDTHLSIKKEEPLIRIRSNLSDWVLINNAVIEGERFQVRIRSIANGQESPWLISERIKLI